jgi:hypothetical protein
MHPIERLRWVARAGGDDLSLLVQEAAGALSGFADDPPALVTACRSLVDRHPAAGPVWWLAARCLMSADPVAEAWEAADALARDGTGRVLEREVPAEAEVVVLGWPEVAGAGLRRRPDTVLLTVDTGDEWSPGPARLARAGLHVVEVPTSGLGAAVAHAQLLVLEAAAMGPEGFVAEAGSRAAAAVAAEAGVAVWVVAGVGRVLPDRLWGALCERLAATGEPWLDPVEVVPFRPTDIVVRASGRFDPATATATPDCPFAPELLRPLDAPGSHRP